jgi:hypothetical protein
MDKIEIFHRGEVLGHQSKFMLAPTYNAMHTLFQGCGKSCLFVPIRSMQYMAVIDTEEIIFVDSQRKAYVEFTWKKFHPQSRTTLTDPVPYQFVYYNSQALETMQRMQGEFTRFIHQMMDRKQAKWLKKPEHKTIVPFPIKKQQQ